MRRIAKEHRAAAVAVYFYTSYDASYVLTNESRSGVLQSNKRCSKGVQVLKGKEENAKAALDAMSAGTRPGQSQSANEAAVTAALEAIEEDHAGAASDA